MGELVTLKKVPLYDFQNKTIKGDTTSSWDFGDAESWNTATVLWGNSTTTLSHVQVILPVAAAEVPAPPDMLEEAASDSSLQDTLSMWSVSWAFRHYSYPYCAFYKFLIHRILSVI